MYPRKVNPTVSTATKEGTMRDPGRLSVFPQALQLRRRLAGALGVVLAMGAGVSCMSVTALRHEALTLDDGPRVIRSSVKAHMADGSTVLFPDGVTIEPARVTGSGDRYDIRLSPVGSVSGVARDSVVAMERFRTVVDGDRTVAYNALPSLISVAVAIALLASR